MASSGIIGQRLEGFLVDANDCRQLLLMVRSLAQSRLRNLLAHGFETADLGPCVGAQIQPAWRKRIAAGASTTSPSVNALEEALRDSESRYRAILQTTAEGYVLIDLAKKCDCSASTLPCTRILGTRRQELVGARLDHYIALESRGGMAETAGKVCPSSQHPRQFELKLHYTLDVFLIRCRCWRIPASLFDPLGRARRCSPCSPISPSAS